MNAHRRDCLSDAELEQLAEAPPGQAPEDLAQHLADCGRCQQRFLFGSERVAAPPRRRVEWPSRGRLVLLLLCLLAVFAIFAWSLYLLTGG